MMDKPSLQEILTAVREFIELKAVPGLTGHAAFHARVAGNVLAIAERELSLGARADAAERGRLIALLNEDGSLSALNARLCAAIADRTIGLETPGLAEHLRLTTLDKIAIDQPAYSGARRARELHEGG